MSSGGSSLQLPRDSVRDSQGDSPVMTDERAAEAGEGHAPPPTR
jgi:hypothetical protein